MAATLLEAIHEVWEADAGLSDLILFDDNPESGRELGTYALIEDLREVEEDHDFEGGKLIRATWTFHAWGAAATQKDARQRAAQTADLIRDAFEDVPPTVRDCEIVLTRQAGRQIGLDETRSTPNRLIAEARVGWVLEMTRRG